MNPGSDTGPGAPAPVAAVTSSLEATPPPDTTPTPAQMKQRTIRGSGISIISKIAEQGLRFASNLMLTRLLFPEAFGLMGLVITLLVGLEMLSDLGVRISIITNRREDRDFLDTAWTISVIRGGVLFVIGLLMAGPFAAFYNEPLLAQMVPAATAVVIFQGATSTKMHVLSRQIDLGRMVALQLSAQVVGLIVMITWALIYRSTWALVAGSVTNAAVICLLSHVALRGPNNRFRWDPSAARDILHMGVWIFVSTMLTFLALRIDVLLLGKLVSKAELGVYNIALNLAGLPTLVGGHVIGFVLLPALASVFRENPTALPDAFARARRAMLPAGGYICLGVALGSPALFYYLFDARYHDAAWMTPLLMLGSWFTFLQEAWSRALQAMGKARPMAASNTAKLIATAAGCIAGHQLLGTGGFILGAAIGALAGHVVTLVFLARAGLPSALSDAKYTVAGVLVTVAGVMGPIWADHRFGIPRMPLSIAVAVLVLVPTGLWTAKRVMAQARGARG